jgi:hypothetical protein
MLTRLITVSREEICDIDRFHYLTLGSDWAPKANGLVLFCNTSRRHNRPCKPAPLVLKHIRPFVTEVWWIATGCK